MILLAKGRALPFNGLNHSFIHLLVCSKCTQWWLQEFPDRGAKVPDRGAKCIQSYTLINIYFLKIVGERREEGTSKKIFQT
jgi:hypothetical protein